MTVTITGMQGRGSARGADGGRWLAALMCAAVVRAGAQSVDLDVGNVAPPSVANTPTSVSEAAAGGESAGPATLHESLQTDLDRALQQSDFEKALTIAGSILAEDPLRMDMHRLRVGLLLETGDRNGAREQHRVMMKVFSNDARALNELAWSLAAPSTLPIEVRDLEVALAAAERAALLTERNDPAVLDTLASVYHAIGLPEKAVETQAEALALAEHDPDVRGDMEAHMAYLQSAARARQSIAPGEPPAMAVEAGPAEGEPTPDPTPSISLMPDVNLRVDGDMIPAGGAAGLISSDPARSNMGDL